MIITGRCGRFMVVKSKYILLQATAAIFPPFSQHRGIITCTASKLGSHHWYDGPAAVVDGSAHQVYAAGSVRAELRARIVSKHPAEFFYGPLAFLLHLFLLPTVALSQPVPHRCHFSVSSHFTYHLINMLRDHNYNYRASNNVRLNNKRALVEARYAIAIDRRKQDCQESSCLPSGTRSGGIEVE